MLAKFGALNLDLINFDINIAMENASHVCFLTQERQEFSLSTVRATSYFPANSGQWVHEHITNNTYVNTNYQEFCKHTSGKMLGCWIKDPGDIAE